MARDFETTLRSREKAYRDMGREVLQILNEPGELEEAMRRVIAALKTGTGFDAVGIRLNVGDDFPYFAQKGFSDNFLRTENTLIARCRNGTACRDGGGRIKLSCTCGMVLAGKPSPFLTPGGSFWTNDSAPLLGLSRRKDPRYRPRNRCVHLGYASVALVPIRCKDHIVGLIQLNDHRKERFTSETVELMESIAASIGSALMRKQLEDALRESSARHRAVFERSFDPILVLDKRTHAIKSVNAAALKIFGYTEAELAALDFSALAALPEPPARAGKDLAEGITRRELRRRDGTRFQAEIAASRCAVDGCENVIVIARDISGREKIEADLRYRIALLKAEQAASPDGIMVIDSQGRIVSHNQNLLDIWGIPEKLLLSGDVAPPLEFMAAQFADPAAFLAHFQALDARRAESSQENLRPKDGRTIDRHSRPVLGPDSEYLGRVWFFRDISGLERAAQAAAKAAVDIELLRARERMMVDMMATVSHEFRTPLAAIKGFAETLRCGGLEDVKNRHGFIQTIERHANRLAYLVEDVLLLTDLDSRAKSPEFKAVDLGDFIGGFVKSLAPAFKTGGTRPTVDLAPGLTVRADADRLMRVFENLLDNAVKYGRRGGRVRIEARADGETALVTIRDKGRGIPQDDLGLIFDRFYRSRATKHIPGTGLGLSIVKAIIELHGGKIWAESALGKGSAFHFTLPLSA